MARWPGASEGETRVQRTTNQTLLTAAKAAVTRVTRRMGEIRARTRRMADGTGLVVGAWSVRGGIGVDVELNRSRPGVGGLVAPGAGGCGR